MSHPDVHRPREVPPPRPQRYRCTNCGLIVKLVSPHDAVCQACGHTRFRSA